MRGRPIITFSFYELCRVSAQWFKNYSNVPAKVHYTSIKKKNYFGNICLSVSFQLVYVLDDPFRGKNLRNRCVIRTVGKKKKTTTTEEIYMRARE